MHQGLRGEIEDIPEDDRPAFTVEGKYENALVGNNERAVTSAAYEAENLGCNPVIWAVPSKEGATTPPVFTRHLRSNL